MKALYLQHVPFEGPGSIAPQLAARGMSLTGIKLYNNEPLPPVESYDFLVIMGGPMSVNDPIEFLDREKKFIAQFIDSGKPVLGICLGAQLIAASVGAKVYPGSSKEIGWFPVMQKNANPAHYVFPQKLTCFHWHGETFDLPPGATLLASSEVCENQAFQLGTNVIGLQFHLETTPESSSKLIDNCKDELIDAPFVQTEQELRDKRAPFYQVINEEMFKLLEYLLSATQS